MRNDRRQAPAANRGKLPLNEPLVAGNYRISILTSRLVRIEYSEARCFSDAFTQVICNRRIDDCEVTVSESHQGFLLETAEVCVAINDPWSYQAQAGELTLKSAKSIWRFGEKPKTLKGTSRTLDQRSGAMKLSEGVISQEGIAILDDSSSLPLDDDDRPIERRTEATDLYCFAYGHDYQAALRDYYKLTGILPLPPRYVFGNWWSKYWAYHDHELLAVVDKFQELDIPLSVCIIDMDWHLTAIKGVQDYWSGWGGYTVNRKYFPDLPGFLKQLHARGLSAGLNLHPSTGVKAYEEQYPAFAKHMGLDPADKTTIPFAAADPRFMEGYFKILLHPYEQQGVDFWWVDWQQGTTSSLTGLDPLWLLNHEHFRDSGKDPSRRPFTFSRWAGPGSQRYPIGFSGDAISSWASLAFQPYFTATAANIGFTVWSHDIGGHFSGIGDGELYARWVQFGVFSPFLRLHSTASRYAAREPWRYDERIKTIVARHMRLRHELVPYIYTAYWRNHRHLVPALRPLYHDHPEEKAAYRPKNEYYFGADLLIHPVSVACHQATNRAASATWLPAGVWTDIFTLETFAGGKTHKRYVPLGDQEAYARAGAIIPLDGTKSLTASANPEVLRVLVFPGQTGTYTLYEDDGLSASYEDGDAFLTHFALEATAGGLLFTITPDRGDKPYLPRSRTYRLEFINLLAKPIAKNVLQFDDRFVYEVTVPPTTPVSLKLETVEIPQMRAILASLDRFLVDWVAPPELKDHLYQALTEDKWTAALKATYDKLELPVRTILKDYRRRLQNAKKEPKHK